MGLWALEQGSPYLASSYFTHAESHDYKEAKFYSAIALTEAQRIVEALQAWDVGVVSDEEAKREIALRLKRILTVPFQDAMLLPEGEKYQFCRYRIGLPDSLAFNKLVNSFDNADYKAQVLLDMSQKYYEADEIIPAIRYFSRIAGLRLTDRRLYEDVQHFELRMLASRKELKTLATQINKGVEFDESRSLEKLWYTSLISEAN